MRGNKLKPYESLSLYVITQATCFNYIWKTYGNRVNHDTVVHTSLPESKHTSRAWETPCVIFSFKLRVVYDRRPLFFKSLEHYLYTSEKYAPVPLRSLILSVLSDTRRKFIKSTWPMRCVLLSLSGSFSLSVSRFSKLNL